MIDKEQDPALEVQKQLDAAEETNEQDRLDTVERIHRELETELDESGEAPTSG